MASGTVSPEYDMATAPGRCICVPGSRISMM
jgi:hypothetical protein